MSSPSVPNVLRGGATITAQALNENFSALAAGLSDGTKGLSVATATVASNVTASYVRVDGDANVTGEANGEKSYIVLFSGTGTAWSGTYFVGWDGQKKTAVTGNAFMFPRSGCIVGYAHSFGASSQSVAGTPGNGTMTIGKIVSGTSSDLFSTGGFSWGADGSVNGSVTTFSRTSYPVSAGAMIYARLYQASAATVFHHSCHLEIQWD